ncbi:MAG: winged helix-turn-helix domain-containing protein [Acidobacteriota bacterium]|nr:MAG: winged helix-turn-helix domain-containing protein [Acidobacteriota bacterium]
MKVEQNTFHDDLDNIADLEKIINSGHYEKASGLLELEEARQQAAGNQVLAEFLGIARQICLACYQSYSERKWHRRAEEVASRREAGMRHQLRNLLEMMPDSDRPSPNDESNDRGEKSLNSPANSGGIGLLKLIHNLIPQLHLSATGQLRREAKSVPASAPPGENEQTDATQPQDAGLQTAARVPDLKIHGLGRFRVWSRGDLITNWQSLKGKAIFKFLLANRQSPVSKEVLMDMFWPETDPDNARRNLHQAIYNIRQTFHHDRSTIRPIVFENDQYGINPELTIRMDFEEFESHCDRGRKLDSAGRTAEAIEEYRLAEDLYQGDFLEEDIYEDWPARKREQLRNDYIRIADRLSSWHQERKEYNLAIEYCRKILARDDCFETAYRRLMQCHQANGQPGLAVRQYHLCAEKLTHELGVSPSPETRSLYEALTRSGAGLGLTMKPSA